MKRFALALGIAVGCIADPVRISLGSCHDVRDVENDDSGNHVWESILDRNLSAFFWLGDAIYGDVTDSGLTFWFKFLLNGFSSTFYYDSKEYLEDRYQETLELDGYSSLVNFVGSENILGTWDDHDYGLNNAGKNFEFRDEAQDALLNFLSVPDDDPRRSRSGVYHAAELFDGTIKAIFLDLRYFRDEYTNTSGDFLGETQWDFLEQELNSISNATLATIIISSLQVLPDDKPADENWDSFPAARQRLFDTIGNSIAPGVILVSGDIHHTELPEAFCDCGDVFILPELTTSGMTHHVADNLITYFYVGYDQFFNPSTWFKPGSKSLQKNFGEIELDADLDLLTVRSFAKNGDNIFQISYDLADLKPFGQISDSCSCLSTTDREISSSRRFLMVVTNFVLVCLLWRAVRFLCLGRPVWKKFT